MASVAFTVCEPSSIALQIPTGRKSTRREAGMLSAAEASQAAATQLLFLKVMIAVAFPSLYLQFCFVAFLFFYFLLSFSFGSGWDVLLKRSSYIYMCVCMYVYSNYKVYWKYFYLLWLFFQARKCCDGKLMSIKLIN